MTGTEGKQSESSHDKEARKIFYQIIVMVLIMDAVKLHHDYILFCYVQCTKNYSFLFRYFFFENVSFSLFLCSNIQNTT